MTLFSHNDREKPTALVSFGRPKIRSAGILRPVMNYGLPRYFLRLLVKLTLIVDWILDGGYLPQTVIRYGIRRQLRDRLSIISSTSLSDAYISKMSYVKALRSRPMAIETAAANEQHYEVGTDLLRLSLGPRMKYSCCLYPTGQETLGQAEIEMLESYVEKGQLADGMNILDLGCAFLLSVRHCLLVCDLK